MDYLLDHRHKAGHNNTAATKELASTLDSGLEIIIFDAYEYQSGRPTTNPEKNLEAYNQLIAREAIRQLAEKLLLEIIYLTALSAYYERLYPSPRFNSYPYANPYPSPGFGSYLYSDPYPNPYANPHLTGYPQNYSRQYFGSAKRFIPRPTSRRFAGYINHHSPFDSFNHSRIASDSSSPNPSFLGRFISTARHSLGRPVWACSKFASLCQCGYLGCAATVSELLQEAGLRINGSASVYGVVNELSNLGWHKIQINDKNQFQAGDIVYGLKGSHAHIGIITVADKDKVLVCDNSSSSGTLKERTIENGGSFTPDGRFVGNLYVLRKG